MLQCTSRAFSRSSASSSRPIRASAARHEVLDQHVAHREQPAEHVDAGRGLESSTTLRLPRPRRSGDRPEVALAARAAMDAGRPDPGRRKPGLVAAGRLDADHLGAERCEQPRAHGARHDPARVDHADALERLHSGRS
jgi:hypothetical protein